MLKVRENLVEENKLKFLFYGGYMREDKLLMSAKEVQAYLGIGINSVRKMMREPNPFTVQIGNRRYANK